MLINIGSIWAWLLKFLECIAIRTGWSDETQCLLSHWQWSFDSFPLVSNILCSCRLVGLTKAIVLCPFFILLFFVIYTSSLNFSQIKKMIKIKFIGLSKWAGSYFIAFVAFFLFLSLSRMNALTRTPHFNKVFDCLFVMYWSLCPFTPSKHFTIQKVIIISLSSS